MTWSGTPEERRAWAIKKRMENAGKSRRSRRDLPMAAESTPLDGYEVHPDNHACTPWTIDYVELGSTCTVCGRTARLVTVTTAADGSPVRRWSVTPITRRLPE
jgi:hypothetical protein